MKAVKLLKKQAKASLGGKWATAVAGLLAVFAAALFVYLFYATFGWVTGAFVTSAQEIDTVVIIKQFVLFFTTFLLAIALMPIINGFFRLCYNIANWREANFADVFYFFKETKRYFKAMQFNIFTTAKLFAAYFITFLGYNIFRIPVIETSFEITTLFIINRSMLFALGFVWFLLFFIRIIFSEFIFVDNENARISEISRATKVIFKHHKLDIILLNYSFIPWIALSFLVIPALYVIPYMTTTVATSTKWLLKLYKEGKLV
ncbi:MAG: DUF975 family protein [Ruminococcus sp.]|nr:DUF975 family protein [Ruminococcus sp.]